MTEKTKEWSQLWLESRGEIEQLQRDLLARDCRIAELEMELRWAITGDMPVVSSASEVKK